MRSSVQVVFRTSSVVPVGEIWLSECVRMSAVDEIISYKRNPDEDYYGMLNCDENSTVSTDCPGNRYNWVGTHGWSASP